MDLAKVSDSTGSNRDSGGLGFYNAARPELELSLTLTSDDAQHLGKDIDIEVMLHQDLKMLKTSRGDTGMRAVHSLSDLIDTIPSRKRTMAKQVTDPSPCPSSFCHLVIMNIADRFCSVCTSPDISSGKITSLLNNQLCHCWIHRDSSKPVSWSSARVQVCSPFSLALNAPSIPHRIDTRISS